MNKLAKLKWQCRRGTRELDLLLLHYLETRYPYADHVEQGRFEALLNLGDIEIMAYCQANGFADLQQPASLNTSHTEARI